MNNNAFFQRYLTPLVGLACAFLMALIFCIPLQAQTNSKGEQFFIVSSVDHKTHQLVLMRPTQLTVAADISPETVCIGENGQKMSADALRAGDTVWAVLRTAKNGTATLVRIREGAMTEAELQKIYLHYSAGTPSEALPPVKPSPLNPPPQTGKAEPPAPAPTAIGSNAMLRGQRRPGERHHPHGPGGPAHSNP